MSLSRDPTQNPTPLDRASFYVEELKYGPGPGKVEGVAASQVVSQLEMLLRDAGVTSMTGQELADASRFYCDSLADTFRTAPILTRSCWMDGLMHGIALAGGLAGALRNPKDHAS